ncbi:hypothetical protein MNBD_GAMMA18-299, partial [hydrothermal vent metagenome]
MILTSAQQNEVTQLTIAMFGAAPGGYKTFLDELYAANGSDMAATAVQLGTQPAFSSLYSGTPAANAATILKNLSVSEATLPGQYNAALAYVQTQIGGNTPAEIAAFYPVALGLLEAGTPGFDFTAVNAVMDKKLVIANAFTAGVGSEVTSLDVLMAQMEDVDAGTPIGPYASLTVEQDAVFGDASDNVFKAFLSTDVNTLQSGDYVNGGA